MVTTIAGNMTLASLSPPSIPRLRLEPTRSPHTLLDGGWWPRSTDPVAELPGLILALDGLRGVITRLVLSADGWDGHPYRLDVSGRVVRLGYFASQPTTLFSAFCDNGSRIDLLIVPSETPTDVADAAMMLAASTGNLIQVRDLLTAARRTPSGSPAVQRWENEGGPELERKRPAPRPRAADAGEGPSRLIPAGPRVTRRRGLG